MKRRYTIGVDFGTLSGRAVLLDAVNGGVLAEAVCEYAHGVMDRSLPDGTPLPPRTALQHPQDYLDSLGQTVRHVVAEAGVQPCEVAGIGIDFTASTLMPVRADGTPLCFEERYAHEPHAYVKLWKHTAAQVYADRINAMARERGEEWLSIYGGQTLGEWAFPKVMQIMDEAPEIYNEAAAFEEAGDWLVRMLTGSVCRSRIFAGLKWLWNAETGYPSEEFFRAVDPRLEGFVGTKIPATVNAIDEVGGYLNQYGAALLGLEEGIPVAVPMVDAEAPAPAVGMIDPGVLLVIVGTSGCQILHADRKMNVPGICGHVKDGVVPGVYTYEAGQACVGDSFAWFINNCVPESYTIAARESGKSIHQYLREKAEQLRIGESGLIALDWMNGNRSVLQDADLSGLILGLSLRTRPEEIYRALIESTAFGLRAIVDAFVAGGLRIDSLLATGGIALKDRMMMQIYADVLNREIRVIKSTQATAMGDAVRAAVVAGLYPDFASASKALAVTDAIVYCPIPENHVAYEKLYAEYRTLSEYFGKENPVMKHLRGRIEV